MVKQVWRKFGRFFLPLVLAQQLLYLGHVPGVPVLDQREGLVGDLLRLLEELAEGGLGLGSLVLERKNSEFNFPLKK